MSSPLWSANGDGQGFAAVAPSSLSGSHPNGILVKFRPQAARLQDGHSDQTQAAEPGAGMLERLGRTFKVRKTGQLLPAFARQQRSRAALGDKAPARLTGQESRLLERSRRVPAGTAVPALDRIWLVELEEGQDGGAALRACQEDPAVEYAEFDAILSEHRTPNDPLHPFQWPLHNTGQLYPASGQYATPPGTADADLDAPEAWDIFTGSVETVVAVIDTGVDYGHRDLQNVMWVNEAERDGLAWVDDDSNGFIDDIHGYDFHNHDGDPYDDRGHGTHCAGIIAAEGDNGLDMAGVCWRARIMPVKFLDSYGWGLTSNAVQAIYYAVANGADVCSNSWGGGAYSQALKEAIDYAVSQGVVMVASAGNDNSANVTYPAGYDAMIAVAATDSNDNRATFSNYGDWVDLAAPGVDILSLRAGSVSSGFGMYYDHYSVVLSGTSMAGPYVAGACALLLGANPTLTGAEVEAILMTSGDPIAPGICRSDRRLNAGAMLRRAVPARGRIRFDRAEVSCSDEIGLLLADGGLAGQGGVAVVVETDGGDEELVTLSERSSGIGVYDGVLTTAGGAAVAGDGVLQVANGQTLTAVYEDNDDGTGQAAVRTASAAVDCAGPAVADVRTPGIGAFWARIAFETDEPSRVTVRYGREGGALDTFAEEPRLAMDHSVTLYHLGSETGYYFDIVATDAFGNLTTDDNGGQFYRFTTRAEVAGLHVPIEYPTLQAAIDAAAPGETVWVADGRYRGEGNRDLDCQGKAIRIQSESGPEYCIVDSQGSAGNSHCGFHFHLAEGPDTVLDGLTITGGYAEFRESIGGGIVCDDSSPTLVNCIISNNVGVYGGGMKNSTSSPAISHCRFSGNAAHLMGGAIYNYNSHPQVTDCVFIENLNDSPFSDEWGGGAVGNHHVSHPSFTRCRFEGNFTYGQGAGIYNSSECDPVLKECLFIDNHAQWGGAGVACDYSGCDLCLVNCRFINNRADQGGGVYCGSDNSLTAVNCLFDANRATNTGGGLWIHNSPLAVTHCTFYGNEALSYGGGIHNQSPVTGQVANSIFLRNRDFDGYTQAAQIYGWSELELSHNCIEQWDPAGSSDGWGNTGADPRLLNPEGEDRIAGTEDDNLRPGPGSPCLDAGDGGRIPSDRADLDDDGDFDEPVPLDLEGRPRGLDDPETPDTGWPIPYSQTPVADMGAYEGPYQGFRAEPRRGIVPEGGTTTLSLSLSLDPLQPVAATVVCDSGDPDISLVNGPVFYFDSSNYRQPQAVVLAGGEDGDFVNGAAWLAVRAQGIPSLFVAVEESDNEPVPAVVFVDGAAAGKQTGLSWADGFVDLQSTLKHARQRPGIGEIRVAQGTWRPAGRGGNRYESFVLIEGMELRGGYAGVRHANPDARDPSRWPTVLSGDLNGDDSPDFQNYQDNSYHVVTGKNLSGDTVLSGFIVEAGYANGRNIHNNGGGMLNLESSNPVIADCQFRLNLASGNGSGMCNDGSSPYLVRCRFTGNSMGGNSGAGMFNLNSSPVVDTCEFAGNRGGVGGGMANNGTGQAVLRHCLFRDNRASFGGGLDSRDQCNPLVIDCTFEGNHADYTGGALRLDGGNPVFTRCYIVNNEAGQYDWGGAGINMNDGKAVFENCAITGNRSGENGGGMFVWNGHAYLNNCTLAGNTATGLGGGIYLFSHLKGSATLTNCILWNANAVEVEGKAISARFCDIEGGYAGMGNIDLDPRFADGSAGDYHLLWDSPCIDQGDWVHRPEYAQQDIDGEPRLMGNGRVDMGSDEVGPKQADLTRDGRIDQQDWAVFQRYWLAGETGETWNALCDLSPDRHIGLDDLARFACDWLWQADWRK